MYDIKHLNTEDHKKYTGVGNELILENLKKLLLKGAKIWIRIPVIANVNDSEEDMLKIKSCLDEYVNVEKVELLPYHAMGENKYSAIGKKIEKFSAPEENKMNSLKNIFV